MHGTEPPTWLTTLFTMFAVNYKNLWTDSLKDPALERAQNFIWQASLAGIPEEVIMVAGMQAIKLHNFPPSIHQFLELTSAIQRNHRMENETQKVLKSGTGKYHRDPVSPLLAEYMAKNPPKEDDPFKLIFQKYSGQELGTQVLKEIKRQLGGKNLVRH